MAAEGAVLINLGKLPRPGVPAPPGPELSAGGRRSERAPALKTCSTSRGGDPEDLSGASSERRLRATTPPLLSPLPYDSRHCRRGRQPRASWSRAPTRGAEGWRRSPAAEGAPEAGTLRTTARPNSRGNVGLLGWRGPGERRLPAAASRNPSPDSCLSHDPESTGSRRRSGPGGVLPPPFSRGPPPAHAPRDPAGRWSGSTDWPPRPRCLRPWPAVPRSSPLLGAVFTRPALRLHHLPHRGCGPLRDESHCQVQK